MRYSKALPSHPASAFQWKDNVGHADASDLPARLDGRVYDDAADIGFRLEGRREAVVFTLSTVLRDSDGDAYASLYEAVDGPFKVYVYND